MFECIGLGPCLTVWEDTPFEGKGRDSAVMILLKKLAKLKGDERPEGVARLKHPRTKYVPCNFDNCFWMGHDTSDHGKYSYIYIFLILLNLDTICLIGRHERKNHWNSHFGIPDYSWEIDDTKFNCSQPDCSESYLKLYHLRIHCRSCHRINI